jgi:hypothetical protein
MRFISMVKADQNYENGAPPDPRLMQALGKLTEDMMKAGVIVEVGGLLPTAMGARVRAAGGKLTVTDGPFAETKEVVGGYAILQVRSKDEAVELGRKFLQAHVDTLGSSYQGELELRQLFDPGECAGQCGAQQT